MTLLPLHHTKWWCTYTWWCTWSCISLCISVYYISGTFHLSMQLAVNVCQPITHYSVICTCMCPGGINDTVIGHITALNHKTLTRYSSIDWYIRSTLVGDLV